MIDPMQELQRQAEWFGAHGLKATKAVVSEKLLRVLRKEWLRYTYTWIPGQITVPVVDNNFIYTVIGRLELVPLVDVDDVVKLVPENVAAYEWYRNRGLQDELCDRPYPFGGE